RRKVPCLGCLVLALALFAHATLAQPTAPGRIERDVQPPPQPVPREGLHIEAPRFAEQLPPDAANLRFTLGAVALKSNTRFTTEQLEPIWAASIGRSITLADAFAIAATIS